MAKNMNIQDIFQQPYDRAKWTNLLADIFANVSIYQNPHKLEDKDTNFVREFLQLGNVRLKDGKNLAIFEVSVDDKIELSKNRVGLRDLISSKIDLGRTHGVLCIFNSSDVTFRFTFVCKETLIDESGQITTTETNSKKFTYILGPGETRRTAAQRFQELASKRETSGIMEIVHAFSVERLNEEFFQLYKRHYQFFVDHLITATDAPSRVFGVNVRPGSDSYDLACKPIRDWVKKLLGRIVFIHFIQKKGWMGCKPSSKGWEDGDFQFLKTLFNLAKNKNHFYSSCLAPLFFDALNSPDRTGDLFALTGTKVPYLNGGLFEETEIKSRELDFPATLFQGLLDFFSAYNFTIDENDPDENEVGIDPEMLGHIFENLLEENKDKGAYYTPKTVVQFMCQQSLILYLRTKLGEQPGLEKLVREKDSGENSKENWIRQNASRIEELLDNVTICDPAIGSGAFPMGMLQEIFWIKLALDWTLNEPNKFAQIKRRIIEHTIHGIDIDAGAVEIARLRIWLSLVVDELEPRPLPNLDFKIHCANSLIEYMRGEPVNLLRHETLDPNAQKHIKLLELAKAKLFEASRKPEKRAARLAIYQALTELGRLEFTWLKTEDGLFGSGNRSVELEKALKEYSDFSKQLSSAEKLLVRDQEALLSKLEGWYGEIDKLTFAWRIHFAEVFKNGGFDIVIANPPYISSKVTRDKAILKERYKTYDQSGDIYVCFYELAVLVSNSTGVISYISSNQFFRADYGLGLRKYMNGKTKIDLIFDVSTAPIFEAAAYPAILQFSKKRDKLEDVKVLAWEELGNPPFDQFRYRSSNALTNVNFKKITDTRWLPINEKKIDLLNYLMTSFPPLSSLKKYAVRRGVVTGRDKVFIIDEQVKDSIISKDANAIKLIKPILGGRDLSRWQHDNISKYLVFTKRGTNINDYPELKKWMSGFREILEPGTTRGRKAGPYAWYEVQDATAYAHLFESPKIAWGNLSRSPKFCWVENDIFLNAPSPFLVGGDKALLALLNSPIIHYLVHYTAAVRSGGYREYKNVYIERMPIPLLSDKLHSDLTALSEAAMLGSEPSDQEYLELSAAAFRLSNKQILLISDFLRNWNRLVNV
jgi:type I restriction-modification system DNA methylase subunit